MGSGYSGTRCADSRVWRLSHHDKEPSMFRHHQNATRRRGLFPAMLGGLIFAVGLAAPGIALASGGEDSPVTPSPTDVVITPEDVTVPPSTDLVITPED